MFEHPNSMTHRPHRPLRCGHAGFAADIAQCAPMIENPDNVSTALGFVRTHGEVMCRSEFTAPWAVSFESRAAHLHIVERGSMFVAVGDREPAFVEAGGVVFVGPGNAYRIASATDVPPVTIRRALAIGLTDPSVLRLGGGGAQCDVICSQFTLEGVVASRVARHLPPLFTIHPSGGPAFTWIAATSRLIADEVHRPRPGSGLMTVRLLDLLFVQVLRVWGEPQPERLSWLSGLDDPQIGRVLAAIHADAARPWSLRTMAAIGGLGRSAFVERFSRIVGESPLRYVTRWRLYIGSEMLRAGAPRIADVAAHVGYGSETAFAHAFRAEFGVAPGAVRPKQRNNDG